MKLKFLIGLLFLAASAAFAQNEILPVSIIPQPVSVQVHDGKFTLPASVSIRAANSPDVEYVSTYLKSRLQNATGANVTIHNVDHDATIYLVLYKDIEASLGDEGYRLSITPKQITIRANKSAGLFYGVQSLLQLFPAEIESKTPVKNVNWVAPTVEIMDYPRFGWRGLMFDVARHFFTVDEVKSYIDNMVKYKYNLLHLHLSDDEGWRMEIKGYPNLTTKGAYNVKKVGYFGTFSAPLPNEPRDYGGFYTQEDIKELVAYAKSRFVDILPEIDVPGHSLAAVASYPELSCTPEAVNYQVRSGEKIMDWSKGPPPIALLDNTLCPANENVYTFLDTVITQLAQLFPFDYIHMGGDETPKNYWAKNDQIKALMVREGLKTPEEVQSYFTRRVEKIVSSKGKKFIGWDEILEGGLAPNTAVMSWRGTQGGIEAAKMGHEVVMSPSTYAYIDYMQADPIIEAKVYASLRLNKSYEFDPLPAGVQAKYIKGGQANLWTEQIYNMRKAEYMTWPRGLAIAESVWSQPKDKIWGNFVPRVESHFNRLDFSETNYSRAVYDPIFKVSKMADGQIRVELSTEISDLDVFYSFDNSFPDKFYPKYTTPLIVPKDAANLIVRTYRNGEPVGRMNTMPVEELKRRVK